MWVTPLYSLVNNQFKIIMTESGIRALEIRDLIQPIVRAVVAEINPTKDIISTRTAYSNYGRKWIEQNRINGNLSPVYHGNKVCFSVREIETLLVAEREQARIIKSSV